MSIFYLNKHKYHVKSKKLPLDTELLNHVISCVSLCWRGYLLRFLSLKSLKLCTFPVCSKSGQKELFKRTLEFFKSVTTLIKNLSGAANGGSCVLRPFSESYLIVTVYAFINILMRIFYLLNGIYSIENELKIPSTWRSINITDNGKTKFLSFVGVCDVLD